MRQVVQDFGTGDVRLEEVAAPALREGFVRVRTAASVVSVGTERAIIELARRSLMGKARARPDLVARVWRKLRRDGLSAAVRTVKDRLGAPMPLGYASAGVVTETTPRATPFVRGDRVACAGAGFANHAEENVVPRNLLALVPSGVSLADAAFATLGAIALNAHRAAGLGVGDRVAVVGAGLLGTLSVRIARAAGVRVLAVDLDPLRRARAAHDGAEVVAAPEDAAAAARAWTGRAGVDAVVIAAATADERPVSLAADLVRKAGVVVALGDVPLRLPRRLYYAKEATLRVATSYGPGRYDRGYEEGGRDYPLAYVRWTAGRNLEAFLRLLAAEDVRVDDLADDRPLDEAVAVYEGLLSGTSSGKAPRFLYREGPVDRAPVVPVPPIETVAVAGGLRTALVGAGAFARGTLWPALRDAGLVPCVVTAATGASAADAARRLHFARSSTETGAALAAPDVDVVVVATPHDTHADLAARALRAGKHVFVEKPLAIDDEGLATVLAALEGARGILTVGFNRRFSPAAVRAKAFLAAVAGPCVATYRVNAGPVPDVGWHGDARQSGGRLVGEACHMIDLLAFLTGERPVRVAAAGARGEPGGPAAEDLALTFAFDGGSVACLTYHSVGDPALGKERVEVARADRVAVIDDFRALTLVRDGRRERTKLAADKGHRAEAAAFTAAVRTGGPPPIPYAELLAVTRAAFAARRALGSARFEDV